MRPVTGTIIFDLDSTILKIESLEEFLKFTVPQSALPELTRITNLGMEGTISFAESFQKRLNLARASRQDLAHVLEQIPLWISSQMQACIQFLKNLGLDIWILSGGLHEVVQATANYLNLDPNKGYGVKLLWNEEHPQADLKDPFFQGKLNGAKNLAQYWTKPAIIVGDGYTDFELYSSGLCQYFIAYAEHVKRPRVLEAAKQNSQFIASNCFELQNTIINFISEGNPNG